MNLLFRIAAAAVVIGSVVLMGCSGGSSSGSNSESDVVAGAQLSGTAAKGAPIEGFVYVKDAQGVEVNAGTDSEGKFTISLDGMQGPYMIKVVANDDSLTMYSFAADEGVANATPLTNLALFLATDKANLEAIYDNWDGTTIDESALGEAQAVIKTNLAAKMVSEGVDVEDYDFIKEPFDADSSGIDAVLDAINVVVDLQLGDFTFQVIDDAAFVFDENINAAGVDTSDDSEWPNGGEAAYPVVASMAFQDSAATYSVFDDNPFILGTPQLNEDQELKVSLLITLDEEGVLTLTAGSESLQLSNPVIYKEQPNQIIWKDSASNAWIAGIVVPNNNSVVVIGFDVTTPFHHDEEGYQSKGLIEFDVFPLQ